MTSNALSLLRSELITLGIDAFIVASGDAHQSEYVSDADERRQFVSGFTGSAGTALILSTGAYLWTDGRYFLQASNELSEEWTLMKSGQPGVPELNEWVIKNMLPGQSVGVDPFLIPNSQASQMKAYFAASGINLVAVEPNPIDKVWSQCGRPSISFNPLVVLPIDKTGKSHQDKIQDIQSIIINSDASSLLVSALDEVSWLFNIRGGDVQYNPVALSYAVVTLEQTYLFVDPSKVMDNVRDHLGPQVTVLPYEDVKQFLTQQSSKGRVIMDPAQVNWSLYSCVGDAVLPKTSPIVLAKSLKNPTELEGFRQCHIRDGAALTAFFHWLETFVKGGGLISEYQAAMRLEEFRGKMKDHRGPSFTTIAAYGPNAAMMHYSPKENDSAIIGVESTFLCDSGAQYLDGTTDVTRTMHFGIPSEHMKDCYTAVLKGHIALDELVIPEGTLGSRFDSVARMPLWQLGLDYNHGTGHGVGSYLNVHEGPQGIGFRKKENEVGYFADMTTSNEPGYYEDGNFGIRIENLCITVPKNTKHNFMGKKYVGFETVTMSPIATNLLQTSALSDGEVAWLNAYHARVRTLLLPYMQETFPESVNYLIERTAPLV